MSHCGSEDMDGIQLAVYNPREGTAEEGPFFTLLSPLLIWVQEELTAWAVVFSLAWYLINSLRISHRHTIFFIIDSLTPPKLPSSHPFQCQGLHFSCFVNHRV